MRDAVRAELLKVATVPGLVAGLVLATLAIPLTSLLVAATDGLGIDDTVTSGAATGSVVGLLALGAWAATLVAGEYSLQTIVVSAAAVAHRGRLYAAKVAAAAGLAAASAAVAAGVAWLIVLAVAPDDDLGLGNPLALLGIVLAAAAVAATAAATGILTRSPTAAITIVVLAVLLPKAAGGLLGGLEPWVVGASPGTVITQIVEGGQLSDAETFPGGTVAAALAMVAVASATTLAGGLVFARRDT